MFHNFYCRFIDTLSKIATFPHFRWHLRTQYNTATIHYECASAKMHQNFLGVPALLFFSDTDFVSTPEMNAVVYRKWEDTGYPVCDVSVIPQVHTHTHIKVSVPPLFKEIGQADRQHCWDMTILLRSSSYWSLIQLYSLLYLRFGLLSVANLLSVALL